MNKKILSLFLVATGLMMGSFASAAYCSKTISQQVDGWFISRVLLTGADTSIDNTTSGSLSANNYDYFSGLTAPTLVTGQSYTLSIRSGTGAQFSVAAWIDRNGNEVFDTGFDYLGQTDSVAANTFTSFAFTVPMTGVAGTTRLRIISALDAPAVLPSGLITPCGGQNDNGETEDYNVTLAASYTAPATALTGGGARRIIPVDFCPEGDFSWTQYDGLCAGVSINDGVVATGKVHPNAAIIATGANASGSSVVPMTGTTNPGDIVLDTATGGVDVDVNMCADADMQSAFTYGVKHGLINFETCLLARMTDGLTRVDAAKIISIFAMNVLDRKPNYDVACPFSDMMSYDSESQKYAITACQLGIMGLKGDGEPTTTFTPAGLVDKAQLATMLSRMLYGNENNSNSCRYCKHVNALKADGIINVTTDLFAPLKRGRALLMLMRISN